MYRNEDERRAIFDKALADNIKISSEPGRLVELSWWDVYYWLQHVSLGQVTTRLTGSTQLEWVRDRNNYILCLLKELSAKDYATQFGDLKFEGWIKWLKKSAKTAHWEVLARGPKGAFFVSGNVTKGTGLVGRFLLRAPEDCPVHGTPTKDRNFPPAPIETELWNEQLLLEAVDPTTVTKRSKTLETIWAHQRGEGPALAKHDKYSQKVFGKVAEDAQRIHVQEDAKLFVLPTDLERFSKATHLSVWKAPLLRIPSSVGNMSALEILQFYSTLIEHVPGEIGQLQQLTHLDLQRNLGLRSLPPELAKLTSLVSLNLSHCENLEVQVDLLAQLRSLEKLSLPPQTQEAEWNALREALPDCTVRVLRYDAQRRILVDAAS